MPIALIKALSWQQEFHLPLPVQNGTEINAFHHVHRSAGHSSQTQTECMPTGNVRREDLMKGNHADRACLGPPALRCAQPTKYSPFRYCFLPHQPSH